MGFLRRLAVPFVVALAMVLVLAGSVAAASATATTVRDTCTVTGGAWGSGYIALKVRATERGLAGVTRIRFVASLMHQPRNNSATWTLHQTQQHTSTAFPDTAGVHSRTWTAVWNLGGDTAAYRHRIDVTVWFISASGQVFVTRGVLGSSC